jgi:hypothetical protein
MKRRWRGVATATKNESQNDLWLGAMMAAPVGGMRSAPEISSRKYIRRKGTRIARTSA